MITATIYSRVDRCENVKKNNIISVIVVCSGMSDRPVYKSHTPLGLAQKPFMNSLVRYCRTGVIRLRRDIDPSLSLPLMFGSFESIRTLGRAGFLAFCHEIDMRDRDVYLSATPVKTDGRRRLVPVCGLCGKEEKIYRYLFERLSSPVFRFSLGSDGEALLIWTNGEEYTTTVQKPYDVFNEELYSPGSASGLDMPIINLMNRSRELLSSEKLRSQSFAQGVILPDMLLLWGRGTVPRGKPFERYRGSDLVCDSEYACGVGKCLGFNVCKNNFRELAECAKSLLKTGSRRLIIHTELCDRASFAGTPRDKQDSISEIDEHLIKPVFDALSDSKEDFTFALTSDHSTLVGKNVIVRDPVPFMTYDSTKNINDPSRRVFDEITCVKKLIK